MVASHEKIELVSEWEVVFWFDCSECECLSVFFFQSLVDLEISVEKKGKEGGEVQKKRERKEKAQKTKKKKEREPFFHSRFLID